MPPPRTPYAPAPLDVSGIDALMAELGVPAETPRRARRAAPPPETYAGPSAEELAAMAEDPGVPVDPRYIAAPRDRAVILDPVAAEEDILERSVDADALAERENAAFRAMVEADNAEADLAAREARYRAGPPTPVGMPRSDADAVYGRGRTAPIAGSGPPVSGAPASFSEEEARAHGWRPAAEGGPLPGYNAWAAERLRSGGDPAPLELPGRTVRAPRRGAAGARGAPSAPLSAEDALIALLTDRPRDAAPLFDEPSETPVDRALGRNAERADVARARAHTAAVGYANERDAPARAEAARVDNERQRREAMGIGRERVRRAMERVPSLDPERWYHDRGVGGTIGAAIAMGLGSFGASLTGGTNEAVSIINDSISRDIEAQRSAIESGYRNVEIESGLLDEMSREFQSRDAAIEASRAAALESVAAQIAETSAGLDGTEAGINAAEMRDAILAEAAAARAAAEAAAIDDEIARRTAIAGMVSAEATATRDMRRARGGGGPAGEAPTDAVMSAFNRAVDSGTDPATAAASYGIDPRLVPSSGRFAETSAGDRADMVAALSSAVGRVEEIVEANPDDIPAVGIFDSRAPALTSGARTMRQRLRALAEAYGRLHSGGVIGPDELTNFEAILFGSGTEAELREGIATARAEIEGRTVRDREGRTRDRVLDDLTSALGGTVVE